MSKALKIISLDAFNTLFVPRAPVMKQYADIGKKYGLSLTQDQLSQRFPKAYKALRAEYPNYGKSKSLHYEEWWSKLIVDLYHPEKVSKEFLTELMVLFSSDVGYAGYDDVTKLLNKFASRDNVVFIASSNGDPRVLKVLESLDILKHFNKVYLSYDIEVTKPKKEFYDYIVDDLIRNIEELQHIPRDQVQKSIWHIGDEYLNDFKSSYEAGWKSILIDRENQFKELINKTDDEELAKIKLRTSSETRYEKSGQVEVIKIDDDRYVVNSFDQVSKIIGL